MKKVRLQGQPTQAGGDIVWDGNTPVAASSVTISFEGGWRNILLPAAPVGVVPAALFREAPAADPYILHATMYTDRQLGSVDWLEIRTRAPVNVRHRWTPAVGNTRQTVVRPDDTIAFKLDETLQTREGFIELLIEPLADENEMGPLLTQVLVAEAQNLLVEPTVTGELTVSANHAVQRWRGVMRVISTAGAGIALTLPDLSFMRLSDVLLVQRNGAGPVTLQPQGGQLVNNAANLVLTAPSAVLRGQGLNWTAVVSA